MLSDRVTDLQAAAERIGAGRTQEPPEAPEQAAGTEAPPAPPEAQEAPQAPQDATRVRDLNGLAERLGVPIADLYTLRVRTTSPEGESSELSLGELKDLAQRARLIERQHEEVGRERVRIEQRAQATAEMERTYNEQIAHAAALMQALEEEHRQRDAIDWDALRVTNPHEWASRREESDARRAKLEQYRQAALASIQQAEQMRGQVGRLRFAERYVQETQALIRAIPEWRDSKARAIGQAELSDYLKGYGFTDAEIADKADHRDFVLAWKAKQFDALKDRAGLEAKRLKVRPRRVLTPSARQSNDRGADQRAVLAGRLRRTGKIEDAAAVISSLRNKT